MVARNAWKGGQRQQDRLMSKEVNALLRQQRRMLADLQGGAA